MQNIRKIMRLITKLDLFRQNGEDIAFPIGPDRRFRQKLY
jgi:hypothetical protein